ncbi:hypothetical protein HBO40_00265 [Pseudomonas protegens]|uniref:hypothetical protein n=1 Tax=Pseudomonas protegens TaxID=380021 RepID=UPI00147479BB|nr:hypothetical protein [Pseudomonas protegens]NMZ26034.1 hypothetical protein [Pseudomonas protegens]NMZ84645.1 hypothetical protein [Pseudomonas protegens]
MLDPLSFPNAIAFAFEAAGGIGAAAKACNRSYQALNKWRLAGALPRTEYTGETKYAERLATAASEKGNFFDSNWLLDAVAPKTSKFK